MRPSRLILAFAIGLPLVGAALVVSSGHLPALGDDPQVAAKIGYVDVSRVYNECQKVVEQKGTIEKRYNTEVERLKTEKEALKPLEDELELMNKTDRNSPALIEKSKTYQEKGYRLQLQLQLAQREFAVDIDQLTRATYQEILREISGYAQRNGFQLILKIDSGNIIDQPGIDPIQYVSGRQILYSAEARDITKDLLKILNDNYMRTDRPK